MKPGLDCALAAAVLEGTLQLEFRERKLLAAMLQCAERPERYIGLVELMEKTSGEVALQSCLNLVAEGFVDWRQFSNGFRINPEKLMPQPIQKEA